MTTLAAPGINASQTFIPNVDSFVVLPPGFYEVEDELVELAQQFVEGWVAGVYRPYGRPVARAQGSTQAAAHAAGVTFVPASAPAAPAPDPFSGTADPSAGDGLEAPVGTQYAQELPIRTGPSGSPDPVIRIDLWRKTGAADTAWTRVTREPLDSGRRADTDG